MARVLRVDQDHDIVTKYGQTFRGVLVFDNFATDFPNHNLVECLNDDAIASNVVSLISTHGCDFFSAMGHGEYSTIEGQDHLPLWDAGDDFSDLVDCIVHLLSCQTGGLLGRKMVESGVAAFWGYTTDFGFFHLDVSDDELITDNLADIYYRLDAIVDRGILAGKDAREVYQSVTQYVAAVLPQLSDAAERSVLLDNYVHLVCPYTTWGDPAKALA